MKTSQRSVTPSIPHRQRAIGAGNEPAPRADWAAYEQAKRQIEGLPLSPEEYTNAIRRAAAEAGV